MSLTEKINELENYILTNKDELINNDKTMLDKVFNIEYPSQNEIDTKINNLLSVSIKSNFGQKSQVIKEFSNILKYYNELKPYLQFYYTIIETDLQNVYNDWLTKFKSSDIDRKSVV